MGEVFAGRYELIDMIGEGGMGGVWRAYDLRDGSVIAAKVLRQSDAGSLLRFMREQGMRIHHPNVVTPLGWAGADDRVLLTMPLVDGGSLAGLAQKQGPLAAPYAAELLRQVLDALTAVHDQRIIHRDIKPANMLLSSTGTGKPHLWLTDFGVAVSQDAPRLTHQSIVMGTPGYLAPEQLRGHDPDPRSDLYAVGMMGIQLLTGHRPAAHTRTSPDDLPPRPANVPESLWHTMVAMAHPDIDQRPTSAKQARDAIADVKWERQSAVDVRSELPPLGESSGEFAPGGRTVAFGTDNTQLRTATAQLRAGQPGQQAAVARAGTAKRLQRMAALVGAPLVALAAIGAIWLTGGEDKKAEPGLARLGAQCSWADVGTTEPDQNGVPRTCTAEGNQYVWKAQPQTAGS